MKVGTIRVPQFANSNYIFCTRQNPIPAFVRPMQLINSKVYLGPNRWSRLPTCELLFKVETSAVDAERLADTIARLHELSGVSARTFPIELAAESTYRVAFEYEEKKLLDECIALALQLCCETPANQQIDITPYYRKMVDLADDIRLGPSSRAILRAATARGIPYFRMNQGSLVQFGEGALQRRTWTAETDATSAIAESIAGDKQLTRSLLDAVGVNVPKGRSVVSREDAWAAALEVGVPVAVKPRNANHAVGVSLDLHDQQAVMDAYDWACQAGHTTDVLVEQYIDGDHHRVLVIGGKCVAAAKGQREYVYGDGNSSIRQLVEQLNADPRRGENYTDLLQVVKLDDAAAIQLRKQGLDFDSVPEQGRQVLVWHVGDLIEDCTDAVHPATRDVAVLAAKTIGLDIAGMDLVAKDISKPLTQQRGCIIEVNAGPSLTPHVQPLHGKPRPVGEAVVQLLYPGDAPSKIPTVLVIQSKEFAELPQEIASTFQSQGHKVGIASERTAIVDSWPIQRHHQQYRSLLMHPMLTAAIIELTPQALAEFGVLCEHVDYVLLSESLLNDPSADAGAAFQVAQHLLEVGGQVFAIGGSAELATSCASRLAVAPDRVSTFRNVQELVRQIASCV